MANGADIAKAYVQIIPSADGIKGSLENLMGGEAESAGKKSGGKFSKFFGGALKAGGAAVAGMAAGATALTGAMVAGANATAEAGDQIDKMSQKLGFSTGFYQKFGYVLSQSGADINSMGTGLKTLTNKLDDAKNGSESAQAMFEALGLSMEDLSSMSREDVFAATISGFQGMADSTERAALANDLFGKSGQELTPLFNTSVEETQAMMQAAEDLGMVMSNDAVKSAAAYKDSLDTLQRTLGGAKNAMMGDFLPSITTVMDGLTALFSGDEGGIDQISQGISDFVTQLSDSLPSIMDAGSNILLALIDGIVANLPTLLGAAGDAIITITEGLIENLPQIIESGLEVLLALAQGIAENLPTLIPTIVDVVLQIVDSLIENVDMLIDASIEIILALADGLIESLPRLLEKAPEIVGKLVDAIIENAPKLLKSAFELIKKLGEGIRDNFHLATQKGKEIVGKIGEGIREVWESAKTWGSGVLSKIGKGITDAWDSAKSWGRGVISRVVQGIRDALDTARSIGLNIVQGIWSGISNGYYWITEKISGWVGDVMSFVKRLFGISSPSKWARDTIGLNIAKGMGLGIEDGMDEVTAAMRATMPGLSMTMGTSALKAAPSYNYGGVTIQIVGREKDADTLARELQTALERRVAVWA